MHNYIETYKTYLAEFQNRKWTVIRALLADNFRFQGPLMQAGSADDFVAEMHRMNPDFKFTDEQMVAHGNLIMCFYTTHITRPAPMTMRCAERVEFVGGKILSVELIFDGRVFAKQG